jgi:quercetin dioxygenase-like cupin family protein
VAAAQAPIPDEQVPQRTQIFSNKRVSASRLDLKPGETAPMHVHQKDTIVVFITSGPTHNIPPNGAGVFDVVRSGMTRFRNGPYVHSVRNDAHTPFRAVVLTFADPQGRLEQEKPKTSRYCNPGSKTVCVEETMLFCTQKACVEDVTISPGAVTTKHSHTTDHMLVAVSDYELTDQIEGKPKPVVRRRSSGEVEYISAGITHQLTNTGTAPARFIVVLWR